MGEPELSAELGSEQALTELAAAFARVLRAARAWPLLIGLRGDLGTGKTTWVRAMLRGLGYDGRVPSPTYTLLEQYAVDGLTLVHLDLYRLRSPEEIENLGWRDWLVEREQWIAVEWPERAPAVAARCDLTLELAITATSGRRVTFAAGTVVGSHALEAIRQGLFNNGT
jgi:tRNA threonylcarbamoyladenosine biosynthesis protein TsaE